jgi:hypothetical protein
MAQGHRFKSEWRPRLCRARLDPHSGRFGRFAKPSRNGRHLRIPVEDRQEVEGWIEHPAPTLLLDVASSIDHS